MRYKKAPKGFGLSGPGAEQWAFKVLGPFLLSKMKYGSPEANWWKCQNFFWSFFMSWGTSKMTQKNLGKCKQNNFWAQKTRFWGLSWASCGTIQPTSN